MSAYGKYKLGPRITSTVEEQEARPYIPAQESRPARKVTTLTLNTNGAKIAIIDEGKLNYEGEPYVDVLGMTITGHSNIRKETLTALAVAILTEL